MNNRLFENLMFQSEQDFQQINEGFKEGAKKVGNSLGRIAKSTAKGAGVGAAVGAGIGIASKATGNSQKGSVAVGAGIGAAIGGTAGAIKGTTKQIVNGTKKLFNKKPAPKKKLNQDIDTFDDFTDMDFQKFEDDYLQNQQGWDLDIEDEMQSLNESVSNKQIFTKLQKHLDKNKFNLSEYGTPLNLIESELIELDLANDGDDAFDKANEFVDNNKRFFVNFIVKISSDSELDMIFDNILEIES